MKNQYFADRRDLLKYELLLDLATYGRSSPHHLLSLLMLTPDDDTSEGSVKAYEQGLRRHELHKFLRDCLAAGTRKVSLLRNFFREVGLDYLPHSDHEYFYDEGRSSYFDRGASLAQD